MPPSPTATSASAAAAGSLSSTSSATAASASASSATLPDKPSASSASGWAATGEVLARSIARIPHPPLWLPVSASLFAGGVVVYHVLFTYGLSTAIFAYHPLLMAIGYFMLLLPASHFLGRYSPLPQGQASFPRARKVNWHWIAMAVAMVAIVGGFYAIYESRTRNNKIHFKSWHAKIGVAAIVFAIVQGFSALPMRFPNLRPAGFDMGQNVRLHRIWSVVVLAATAVCLILSFFTGWFLRNSSLSMALVMVLCVVVTVGSACRSALRL
ncbi:hypothetical protein CAOG_06636 [Capsaspora owczarzaki ATCC 30864]|uniref:Cytochrome b561 domain-containing protein n=1 Tax=Capsaspora owczarzaki (strain ATCC 30864) TaxID=595528 RepID=A0A0D2WVM1_CAPO3|nr:hypothetical protein CAOG_06636 [Capsaspora owczarzaki ATCC 30864]KJE96293.1 hypothetical protein CAOG_006636 [Capsaspora owczarzaki ATCC 30864]|eukprot:XP_004344257.1 hypothetical protein CAOG_06636 [Capsaspora owczarzaki ATCC 30864]